MYKAICPERWPYLIGENMGSRGSSSGRQGVNETILKKLRASSIKPYDKFNGMTMAEAEEIMRRRKKEYAIVVDNRTNKVIIGYEGNKRSVFYPEATLELQNVTFSHNHPHTESYGWGGTFSKEDINSFSNSKWSSIRAVSGGKGEKSYAIVRNKGANGKAFNEAFNRYRNKSADYESASSSALESSINTMRKAVSNGHAKFTRSRASEILGRAQRQAFVGRSQRWLKDNASNYGFSYITLKK